MDGEDRQRAHCTVTNFRATGDLSMAGSVRRVRSDQRRRTEREEMGAAPQALIAPLGFDWPSRSCMERSKLVPATNDMLHLLHPGILPLSPPACSALRSTLLIHAAQRPSRAMMDISTA